MSSLFDQDFYQAINRARWDVAAALLEQLTVMYPRTVSTCLDAGCGPGWFSEKLRAAGLQVAGIDGRESNIALARERVTGGRFHVGDLESESIVPRLGSFDLVFCFGLLYHTENPFRVLRNLKAMTKELLLLETQVIPGDEPTARLVSENANDTQGLTFYSLIPTKPCLSVMLHAVGYSQVYEYVGEIRHEDFVDGPTRFKRRGVFLASMLPLALPEWVPMPAYAASKYDYTKR